MHIKAKNKRAYGAQMVYALFTITFLLVAYLEFFSPSKSLTSAQIQGDRQQFYRRLAYFHAPINFQDTEVRGETQDERNKSSVDQPIQRRGDFITRVDFDGDLF
jgi:hypothetical protein